MRVLHTLLALAIGASTLMLGTGTAVACSCALVSDAELVDVVDVIFRGTVIDYQYIEDPDGDGTVSSLDPATFTFAVEEVYKGNATETQRVLSPVDGASCGLEIPDEGEFIVFAQSGLYDGPDLAEGELAAYLCDGTRLAEAGFDTDLVPYPPDPNPAVTAAPAGSDAAAQELIDRTTSDTGVVAVVGFFMVCIIAVLAARQFRRTRG
jgi:hypothetical protein